MTHDKQFEFKRYFSNNNNVLLESSSPGRDLGEPGSRSLFDYDAIFGSIGNCPLLNGKVIVSCSFIKII